MRGQSFSPAYCGLYNMPNLSGKTVVLTRGTVHETGVPKLAERQKLPLKFVYGADHNQSFDMLATAKADAFAARSSTSTTAGPGSRCRQARGSTSR